MKHAAAAAVKAQPKGTREHRRFRIPTVKMQIQRGIYI
jgi:hypothetical protein